MNWNNEQLCAINTENTNIIVSAGAGSGKTAVLTERVLRKIKNGIPINKLLILTFTNLAAKEMKDRIKQKLIDEKLIDQLLLIDSAYITTFDSYSLSLVRKYHYLLGISKNIKICDKNILLIKSYAILDTIFEKLYKEKNEKFLNLINNFCVKDDKIIRKFIINTNEKMSLIVDKDKYLDNYLNNNYNDDYINQVFNNYLIYIKEQIKEINTLLLKLDMDIDSEYSLQIHNLIDPLLNSKTIEEIYLKSSLTLPNLKKGSSDEIKNIKKNITTLIKKTNILSQKSFNDIKDEINKTKPYNEVFINIIKNLNTELNNYKQKNELYDFIDIEFLAIKLLKNNTNIREDLKNYFNEIMIDEYQDTNDIQEEFITLIANNNVYMVGDIKQSIYRFRNANPYIFKNKYDSYNGDNGIKINLNQNFRSRKAVLDDINLIFNKTMNDKFGGADYEKDHNLKYGNLYNDNIDNHLSLYNYSYDKNNPYLKEEIETNIILNDIKDKIKNNYQIKDKNGLRNVRYSDFCILVDRMSDAETIKKIFESNGIPLTKYSDNSITNNMDIIIIKNIVKILIKIYHKEFDQTFKYLFYSIGRSYLIEYNDEYLFTITTNNTYKNTNLFKMLNDICNKIPYSSITDIIYEIINTFQFYEKQLKIDNIEENTIRIEYLIELSINLSNYGWTIFDFNEYLNELTNNKFEIKYALNKESPNSVQLMTIHGSKGLEFNICYYMELDNNFNTSDIKDKFIYDKKYGIITPYFEEGLNETILTDLVKDNYYKEEVSEKIRLLYVALTRTKEKMILIVNNYDVLEPDISSKYKTFRDILLSIKKELKPYLKKIDEHYENINMDYKYGLKNISLSNIEKNYDQIETKELKIISSYIEEKTFSKKENKILTKNEKELFKKGNNIHKILETIDFKNIELTNIDEYDQKKIKSFINSNILNDIKEAKIYKEHEFIYMKDNIQYHGIIDLLLEYDNYIKIIDYKLKNIDDVKYIEQLKGYKEYIMNITNKKTYLYLYSIIDEKYKEIK